MNNIPFELHITVRDLLAIDVDHFVNCCTEQEAKPMMIELARGEYIHQPMMNKVIYATSLQQAIFSANILSQALEQLHFQVKRLKIEVPADKYLHGFEMSKDFNPYFEWHGKVERKNLDILLELCSAHQVHLSLNALKKEHATRFVTLREFGSNELFQGRVRKVSAALTAGGWPVIKQQAEYCVYDNNLFLDNGWLS